MKQTGLVCSQVKQIIILSSAIDCGQRNFIRLVRLISLRHTRYGIAVPPVKVLLVSLGDIACCWWYTSWIFLFYLGC